MSNLNRLLVWTAVFAIHIYLYQNWRGVEALSWYPNAFKTDELPIQIIATLCFFSAFRICDISINAIFWDRIIANRMKHDVPGVLKIISGILLAVVFTCFVITQVFEQSLVIFLTFSGGLGLILGIALQNVISDFFSGIVIHFEKPFEIGDFILLNSRRFGSEPLIGQVASINWRTTRLAKTDGTLIVVPNNLFTSLVVTNLNQPIERSRVEIDYTVGFEVDSERVMELILTATNSVDRLLPNPKPKVKVRTTNASGVVYRVRFWVIPATTSPASARDAVNRAILRHLRYAGIDLAPARTINVLHLARQIESDTERANKRYLLTNIPMFKWLSEVDLGYLESKMSSIRFSRGQI